MKAIYAEYSSFFHIKRARLNPDGVIDDQARAAFTRGQCHALAAAIRAVTGWPMVGVGIDPGYGAFHCAVRAPDGRILDIEGAHAEGAWLQEWGQDGEAIAEVTDAEYRSWHPNGDMHKPTKHAPLFVPAVLALGGYDA